MRQADRTADAESDAPARCHRCGGTIVVSRDRRGARWWIEPRCLLCGREPASCSTAEPAPEDNRREDRVLMIPRDMRGWKALMEPPARRSDEEDAPLPGR